jgi:hypothetical protein
LVRIQNLESRIQNLTPLTPSSQFAGVQSRPTTMTAREQQSGPRPRRMSERCVSCYKTDQMGLVVPSWK